MADDIDPRVRILEGELARVRREFEWAIDAVPPAPLHRAAQPDGWTPAQLVWHVAKVERGVARLLERLDAALPPMATVPPGPRSDTVLGLLDTFRFTDRSRKLVAAEGLRPPATVDFVAERGRLADGRAQLLDIIRQSGPRLSLLRHDHMFFGPFDGWQWTLMVARHDERHLLQLAEILAAAG
ncbi:MAG: DinB family protein [Gemmatimonadaceae bacterium]